MPYQPTNPYPYNTAIDLNEGLRFRFKADNYDVIDSFKIEIYDLLKEKKLYTIVRCMGSIVNNTIEKGDKQLLQILDENEDQIYLEEFFDENSSDLPLISNRNDINLGKLDLSNFLASKEQLEKKKYYGDIEDYEDLKIANVNAFTIDENGIITDFNYNLLDEEDKKTLVIPYEIPLKSTGEKIKVVGIKKDESSNHSYDIHPLYYSVSNLPHPSISVNEKGVFHDGKFERVVIPGNLLEIGDYAFVNCKELKRVDLNYGVSIIGKGAFKNCIKLQQINLLDSIKSIDMYAFYKCSLTEILLPTDMEEISDYCFFEAFEKISERTITLKIPSKIKRIGEGAFRRNLSVILGAIDSEGEQYITPPSLEDINNYPIFNLIFNNNLKEIGSAAFWCINTQSNIDLNNSVIEKIGGYVFGWNQNLKDFCLPNTIQSIGNYVLDGNNALQTIKIPFIGENKSSNNTWKNVLGYFFLSGNYKNEEEDFPLNLKKTLQYYNENKDSSYCFIPKTLQQIEITNSDFIPTGAFSGLNLTINDSDKLNSGEVILTSDVQEIGMYSFYNCKINNNETENVSFIYNIPGTVQRIGKEAFAESGVVPIFDEHNGNNLKIENHAFYNDNNITNLKLPNYTTEIENGGLQNDSLTQITLPIFSTDFCFSNYFDKKLPVSLINVIINKVFNNTIPSTAFATSNSNITNITLPDTVSNINSMAFNGLTNLKQFIMPSSVNNIGNNAFNFSAETVLYWTSLLDKNSALSTKQKEDLFGNNIVKCNGNVGVVSATSTEPAKVWTYVSNATHIDADKTILVNDKVVANYSVVSCLFGFDNVTNTSGSCGDFLTYRIEDKVLKIEGTGEMWDFSDKGAPWYQNDNPIITIQIKGATTIGAYAFEDFKNLTKVELENTITKIKTRAFQNCSSLTELLIPENVNVIEKEILFGSSKITTLSFPSVYNTNSDFKNIGYFWYFETENPTSNSLFKVYQGKGDTTNYYEIPTTLKNITVIKGKMAEAFFYTSANQENGYLFEQIVLSKEDSNTDGVLYGGLAKKIEIVLPEKKVLSNLGYDNNIYTNFVEYIKITSDYDFSYSLLDKTYILKKNSTLDIENTKIKTIKEDTFYTQSNIGTAINKITNIILPSSVTELGGIYSANNEGIQVFWFCKELEKLTAKGVKKICRKCFRDYENLTQVIFSSEPLELEVDAFSGCVLLTGDFVVANGELQRGVFRSCKNITSIELKGEYNKKIKLITANGWGSNSTGYATHEVKNYIGEAACYGCEKLKVFKSEYEIQMFEDSSFENCYSLETIDYPIKSGTIFERYCFSYCSKLLLKKGIEFGKYIEEGAFLNCSSLLKNNDYKIIINNNLNPYSSEKNGKLGIGCILGTQVKNIEWKNFDTTDFETISMRGFWLGFIGDNLILPTFPIENGDTVSLFCFGRSRIAKSLSDLSGNSLDSRIRQTLNSLSSYFEERDTGKQWNPQAGNQYSFFPKHSYQIRVLESPVSTSSSYILPEYAFYNFQTLTKISFPLPSFEVSTNSLTNSGVTKITFENISSSSKKIKKLQAEILSGTGATEGDKIPILFLDRNKEYFWGLTVFGDNYDVYVTDNNTYADKASYLPIIYAPVNDNVEVGQRITLQGENTYEIISKDTFKNTGSAYYKQSKGIISGQLSYYGVANGTLTYYKETNRYEVDSELKKVLPKEETKFSMGSKYNSETYTGTIYIDGNEVVVNLKEGTTYSQFEFGANIALQNTVITEGSLPEELMNAVKVGSKFSVSSDSSIQTINTISDYFNITFTPGIKNTVSGYTNVQMTLANEAKELVLPNNLSTKQILISLKSKGKITIQGKKGDYIKKAYSEKNLLDLIKTNSTYFELNNKEYVITKVDKTDNSFIFQDERGNGYLIEEEQDSIKEIVLKNVVDLSETDFDKTDLALTVNYINIYTVKEIEKYSNDNVPKEDYEDLYLITCEEVVNPTNFEVTDRDLEKEVTLERQSMILTVKGVDDIPIPHLLVEGDTYYRIYSNYIKTPQYYFRSLDKKNVLVKLNNVILKENSEENRALIDSASASFSATTNNNLSYYEWELYEYYEEDDEYYLIDQKTNKYSSLIYYDYNCFKDRYEDDREHFTNYKIKLIIYTIEGLKIETERYLKVKYSEDLVLQNVRIEKDCNKQAIAIDLHDARFIYETIENGEKKTRIYCPFSYENTELLTLGKYGAIQSMYVLRNIKGEPDTIFTIGKINGFTTKFYDYGFSREEAYEYSIVPIFVPINENEGQPVRGAAYKIKQPISFNNSRSICLLGTDTLFKELKEDSKNDNMYLIDNSEFNKWYFKYNAEAKNVNIVTDKAVYDNNQPYATVNNTNRNYKTGSITVMLGDFHKTSEGQWTYRDSVRLQNKFQEFCNNGKVKILRDEIGNVIPVDVTLKSFEYQPQAIPTNITVSFEWTQIQSENFLGAYDYRKKKEIDTIYAIPFVKREDISNLPLRIQGIYFDNGAKAIEPNKIVIEDSRIDYNIKTGFLSLNSKSPSSDFTITITLKDDPTISTQCLIPKE